MYCDNRAKFSMVTTRIACAKCISLMGVTSHDVGSFQSCSVSTIYGKIKNRPLSTWRWALFCLISHEAVAIVHFCDIIWVARPVAIIGNVSCVGDLMSTRDYDLNSRDPLPTDVGVIYSRGCRTLSKELATSETFMSAMYIWIKSI